MNDAEKRIQTVINNYRKGVYSLDQLKDLLDEGLQRIDAIGVKNVEISFIKSLAHLEEAIKRIENAKMRNTAEMQRAPLTTAPIHQPPAEASKPMHTSESLPLWLSLLKGRNDMTNTTSKRGLGHRVNAWLDEPHGETFKHGKWRFWFPALVGFSILNALLTAVVFGSGGNLQTYLGAVILSVGALLAWLGIGALHYSDSHDRQLARGVSALDSVTLIFVIAHFCFLLWVYGHVSTLKSAEAEYKESAEKYNAKVEQAIAANVEIAKSAERVAAETTKAEKLRNDTAYQLRKAAQAGARIQPRSQPASAPASLSTSPIELERQEKPKRSSTEFLTKWDFWVRMANFGELALAAVTLIFIRNRSAAANTTSGTRPDAGELRKAQDVTVDPGNDFPDELPELDAGDVGKKSTTRRGDLTVTQAKNARRSARVLAQDAVQEKTRDDLANGLAALREALSDISFYHSNTSFKAYIKPDAPKAPDHVLVRAMLARDGTQETTHSAKLKLSVLNDAVQMPRDQFRARLTRTLNRAGFRLIE